MDKAMFDYDEINEIREKAREEGYEEGCANTIRDFISEIEFKLDSVPDTGADFNKGLRVAYKLALAIATRLGDEDEE